MFDHNDQTGEKQMLTINKDARGRHTRGGTQPYEAGDGGIETPPGQLGKVCGGCAATTCDG